MELIISPILPKILANQIVIAEDTNVNNNNNNNNNNNSASSSSSLSPPSLAIARRRRRMLVNHEERNVPFGEWGGKCGSLYKDLYSWSAKNLKKVMSEVGFKESEWNRTVDSCLNQLEISKAYDKIHRFWVMKQ